MNIETIDIDRYGPLAGLSSDIPPGLSIIYGPNEAGKTLYLEGLLQLLEPDIGTVLPGTDRIDGSPTGRVHTQIEDERVVFTAENGITDRIDATPHHFRNVFVVRDGDLGLSEEHNFYDQITQRIADIHTTEIEAITERIRERGNLTPTGRLSSGAAGDYVGDTRDDAKSLAADIQDYLAGVAEDELTHAERTKMDLLSRRRSLESERTKLEHARLAKRVDRISETIATVESSIANGQASADRDLLKRVRERASQRSTLGDQLATARSERETLAERCDELLDERSSLEDQMHTLDRRESNVEDLADQLEQYRTLDEPPGNTWLIGAIALSGVLFGGLLGFTGAVGIASLVGVIGAIALVWYFLRIHSRKRYQTAKRALLASARDVGFSTETTAEIGPKITDFRAKYERVSADLESIEDDLRLAQQRLEDTVSEIDSIQTKRSELQETIDNALEQAAVSSIDELESLVERIEKREREQDAAKEYLHDVCDSPPAETDTIDAMIAYWQNERDSLADRLPDDADSATADDARLRDIEDELDAIDEREQAITATLTAHEDAIDEFDARARDIAHRPPVPESFGLNARSITGLRDLERQARAVVDRIESSAKTARTALDIFASIESEEQRKMATIFSETGRVSETFSQLTAGRYEDVRYDPESMTIRVKHRNGTEFDAAQLSRGAYDQLYFATRVGLAELLLGQNPGFFLLDDPFIAADSTRLDAGFSVLSSLAAAGWQIIYFTAKAEVGERMVDAYDVPVIDIPLS